MYQLQDFPSVNHEIFCDVFVVDCYIILRFFDYSSLNLTKIINRRLEVIQKKTMKKVILTIDPLVNEIFIIYNFRFPKIFKIIILIG